MRKQDHTSRWLVIPLVILCQPLLAGENVWTQFGPSGGRVSDVAVSPTDSDVVFATTAGGVYGSDDQGATWTRKSEGIFSGFTSNSVIVFHPNDSDVLTTAGGRMHRSEDGGETWTSVPRFTTVHGAVEQIVFDPTDPLVVYAATSLTCIAKSTDGGINWETMNEGVESPRRCYDVVVDPDTPDTVYASNNAGVYKSTDGGTSWQVYNDGIGDRFQLGYLALRPVPDQLPELFVTNSFGNETSLFKSEDGGETWTPSNTGLPDGGAKYLVWDDANDVFYVITADGPYKSTDGSNWTPSGNGHPKNPNAGSLALDPSNPNALYSTNSSGIFLTVDAGASWASAVSGILAGTYTELEFDAGRPGTAYAGNTSGEIFKSVDSGLSWALSPVDPALDLGYVSDLEVHPAVPDMVFAVGFGSGSLLRSADGGATWDEVGLGLGQSQNALAIDPFSAQPVAESRIYVGGLNQPLHVSLDSGDTFTFEDVFEPGTNAYEIAFDPADPLRLYVALSNDGVARSIDGGDTWSLINGDIILDPGIAYFDLHVSPADPDLVLLRGNRYLYRSTNGGDSWMLVDLPDSPNSVTIHPTNNRIFVSTGDQVRLSKDQGETFKPIGAGLPEGFNFFTYDLELDPSDLQRLVATIGPISMWEFTMTEPELTIDGPALEVTEAGDALDVSLQANLPPASTVSFGLTTDSEECAVAPQEISFDAESMLQTVQISAENDFQLDGTQPCTVQILPGVSEDGVWHDYDPVDLEVMVTDATQAGVSLEEGSPIVVVEYGSSRTLQLALTSIPQSPVTVSLTSSDTGEGIVTPAEIVFPADITAVLMQSAVVAGVDDSDLDGAIVFEVQLTATSADPSYDGMALPTITAVNLDDEEVVFYGDFE